MSVGETPVESQVQSAPLFMDDCDEDTNNVPTSNADNLGASTINMTANTNDETCMKGLFLNNSKVLDTSLVKLSTEFYRHLQNIRGVRPVDIESVTFSELLMEDVNVDGDVDKLESTGVCVTIFLQAMMRLLHPDLVINDSHVEAYRQAMQFLMQDEIGTTFDGPFDFRPTLPYETASALLPPQAGGIGLQFSFGDGVLMVKVLSQAALGAAAENSAFSFTSLEELEDAQQMHRPEALVLLCRDDQQQVEEDLEEDEEEEAVEEASAAAAAAAVQETVDQVAAATADLTGIDAGWKPTPIQSVTLPYPSHPNYATFSAIVHKALDAFSAIFPPSMLLPELEFHSLSGSEVEPHPPMPQCDRGSSGFQKALSMGLKVHKWGEGLLLKKFFSPPEKTGFRLINKLAKILVHVASLPTEVLNSRPLLLEEPKEDKKKDKKKKEEPLPDLAALAAKQGDLDRPKPALPSTFPTKPQYPSFCELLHRALYMIHVIEPSVVEDRGPTDSIVGRSTFPREVPEVSAELNAAYQKGRDWYEWAKNTMRKQPELNLDKAVEKLNALGSTLHNVVELGRKTKKAPASKEEPVQAAAGKGLKIDPMQTLPSEMPSNPDFAVFCEMMHRGAKMMKRVLPGVTGAPADEQPDDRIVQRSFTGMLNVPRADDCLFEVKKVFIWAQKILKKNHDMQKKTAYRLINALGELIVNTYAMKKKDIIAALADENSGGLAGAPASSATEKAEKADVDSGKQAELEHKLAETFPILKDAVHQMRRLKLTEGPEPAFPSDTLVERPFFANRVLVANEQFAIIPRVYENLYEITIKCRRAARKVPGGGSAEVYSTINEATWLLQYMSDVFTKRKNQSTAFLAKWLENRAPPNALTLPLPSLVTLELLPPAAPPAAVPAAHPSGKSMKLLVQDWLSVVKSMDPRVHCIEAPSDYPRVDAELAAALPSAAPKDERAKYLDGIALRNQFIRQLEEKSKERDMVKLFNRLTFTLKDWNQAYDKQAKSLAKPSHGAAPSHPTATTAPSSDEAAAAPSPAVPRMTLRLVTLTRPVPDVAPSADASTLLQSVKDVLKTINSQNSAVLTLAPLAPSEYLITGAAPPALLPAPESLNASMSPVELLYGQAAKVHESARQALATLPTNVVYTHLVRHFNQLTLALLWMRVQHAGQPCLPLMTALFSLAVPLCMPVPVHGKEHSFFLDLISDREGETDMALGGRLIKELDCALEQCNLIFPSSLDAARMATLTAHPIPEPAELTSLSLSPQQSFVVNWARHVVIVLTLLQHAKDLSTFNFTDSLQFSLSKLWLARFSAVVHNIVQMIHHQMHMQQYYPHTPF